MLQPENGIQDERAEEGKEHEARCIFRECHFYSGIVPVMRLISRSIGRQKRSSGVRFRAKTCSKYLPNGFTNMVVMIMKRRYCAAL
jgi:hypothetical protein